MDYCSHKLFRLQTINNELFELRVNYTNDTCFSDSWPGNFCTTGGAGDDAYIPERMPGFVLLGIDSVIGLNSTVFFSTVFRFTTSGGVVSVGPVTA